MWLPLANEVLVERTGARAETVLNRPERRNALTGPLVAALGDALTELSGDGPTQDPEAWFAAAAAASGPRAAGRGLGAVRES
jgi:enoyl-CoA hydratase/carnithine racemase